MDAVESERGDVIGKDLEDQSADVWQAWHRREQSFARQRVY